MNWLLALLISTSTWIYFQGVENGFEHIFRVRVDGSDSQQLTSGEARHFFQGWSPDWLYYEIYAETDELWRMRLDGSDPQPVLTLPDTRYYTVESWSPDGRWMFVSAETGGQPTLYRARPDGSDLQNLTENLSLYEVNGWLGDWLIFSASSGNNMNLYRTDGTTVQNLTRSTNTNLFVTVSPNQEWIYFCSDREGDEGLYRMRADGSEQQGMPIDFVIDYVVGWSGEWLYLEGRSGYRYNDLYRVFWDGSEEQNLTGHLEGQGYFVNWSDEWILFAYVTGDLYLMRKDGSDLHPLGAVPGNEIWGTWSPDGTWIVFASQEGEDTNFFRVHPDGTDLQRLTHLPGYKSLLEWLDRETMLVEYASRTHGGLYAVTLDGAERLIVPADSGYSEWIGLVELPN